MPQVESNGDLSHLIPRQGLRATRINERWHIDVTRIKLPDHAPVYMHACIDNYSRYILAWRLSPTPTGIGCRRLLEDALLAARHLLQTPIVTCDSGSENLNREVDSLIDSGQITREIAQIDIEFSNSMIEAFFRAFKNKYLYQQALTDMASVACCTEFYVQQHNNVIPQSVLGAATPEEYYRGQWDAGARQSYRGLFETAKRARRAHHASLKPCIACDDQGEV